MDTITNFFSFNMFNFALAVIGPFIISLFTGIPLQTKTIGIFLAAITVYTFSILFYRCKTNEKDFKFESVYKTVWPWFVWLLIILGLRLVLRYMLNPMLIVALSVIASKIGIVIVSMFFYYPSLRLFSDCFN